MGSDTGGGAAIRGYIQRFESFRGGESIYYRGHCGVVLLLSCVVADQYPEGHGENENDNQQRITFFRKHSSTPDKTGQTSVRDTPTRHVILTPEISPLTHPNVA